MLNLDVIQEVAKQATPGPWYINPDTKKWVCSEDVSITDEFWKQNRDNDAHFVSKARTDVPELVDRCRELEMGLSNLVRALDSYENLVQTSFGSDLNTAIILAKTVLKLK